MKPPWMEIGSNKKVTYDHESHGAFNNFNQDMMNMNVAVQKGGKTTSEAVL